MKTGLKNNLDDIEFIGKLDKSNSLSSIKYFSEQIKISWDEASKLQVEIPNNISSVYFCGMGGSAYAGRIIKYLFKNELKVPVETVDNYTLPGSVNKDSLVILSSYSGNTQETLSCCNQALSRNLNVLGITSGGELSKTLSRAKKSVYVFDDKLNPSLQPRLGQGYMLSGSLALLTRLKLISVETEEIINLVSYLQNQSLMLDENKPSESNSAKKLAVFFTSRIINLLGGEFLEGALHAVRNPLNETGKHFANYFVLPELNHHLLEGLKFPEAMEKYSVFVFLKSSFFSEILKKRIILTREIVQKNNIETVEITLKGESKLLQVFELMQIMTFVSFYLAVLHNIDPSPVPWVDYFKKHLS